MSAMDEFTELKKIKNDLLEYEWSAEGKLINGLRFFSESCGRTNEHSLSAQEREVLSNAMNYIERQRGNILYNPYKIVGNALRQILIHYCDHKLKKLAEQAKQEAEAVLKVVS